MKLMCAEVKFTTVWQYSFPNYVAECLCIASCASQRVLETWKGSVHKTKGVCYRATGDDTRSLCTTVCKWTYLGHAHLEQMSSKDSVAMKASGWDDLFWQEIGLGDLVESGYSTIGTAIFSLLFSYIFPWHAYWWHNFIINILDHL